MINRNRWTEEEDKVLLSSTEPFSMVSTKLSRSVGACCARVHYLKKKGVTVPDRSGNNCTTSAKCFVAITRTEEEYIKVGTKKGIDLYVKKSDLIKLIN